MAAGTIHHAERDIAAWSVEWLAVPQICMLSGSIVDKLAHVLRGLEVSEERMRANLQLTRNGIMAEAAMMALARGGGHDESHTIVHSAARQASETSYDFVEVLRDHLSLRRKRDVVL